ncbi:MAG: AAA family ATPase [Kiritimatiellae bacterium]|nr:AAA family ATPase [Kiritimatiellia bacterium]
MRFVRNLLAVSPYNEAFLYMLTEQIDGTAFRELFLEAFQEISNEKMVLIVENEEFGGEGLMNFVLSTLQTHSGSPVDKRFRALFQKELDRKIQETPLSENYLDRSRQLQRMLDLDEISFHIIECCNQYRSDEAFEAYVDRFNSIDWPSMIAEAVGYPFREVQQRISGRKGLLARGLIDIDSRCIGVNRLVSNYLLGVSDSPLGDDDISRQPDSPYPLDSFPVKAFQREFIRELVEKPGPCHLLFYGKPGTGKTELAKALATVTGRKAFLVRYGTTGNMRDRHSAITAAFTLVSKDDLLIVDEADGFLNTGPVFLKSAVDKGWINNFLDECAHKVIWIANETDMIDSSVFRRFSYSLEFKNFSEDQRRRAWEHQLRQNALQKGIDPEMIRHFAKNYEVDAGGISTAFQALNVVAHNSNPNPEKIRQVIETVLEHQEKLAGIVKTPKKMMPVGEVYSLEALHTDVPAEEVITALTAWQKRQESKQPPLPANLLFWGNPGTGKTEFAKHLAALLGKTLDVHRMSDLQSMYVGQTEKNIARVFQEAAVHNAILFLDEVDSLILDRRTAVRSWEGSQTNEVLTQMENFRGICICCTNLLDRLDEAVLRRFTWKVKFLPLTDDGKVLLFRRYFQPRGRLSAKVLKALAEIKGLTPGDFKTVWQRQQYMGQKSTRLESVEALAKEVSYKRCPGSKAIGF